MLGGDEFMSEGQLKAADHVCAFCGKAHDVRVVAVNGVRVQGCPSVPSWHGGYFVDRTLMPAPIRRKP